MNLINPEKPDLGANEAMLRKPVLYSTAKPVLMDRHLSRALVYGAVTLLSAVPAVLAEPAPSPSPAGLPSFADHPFIPPPAMARREEHHPFQRTIRFTIGAGEEEGYAEIPLASRQRMVIEHVSALVQGPSGQRYFASLRTTVQREETAWHYLVFSQQYSGAGIDVYAASQPMRAYADPDGLPMRFSVSRGLDDSGTVSVDATITGYLLDRW